MREYYWGRHGPRIAKTIEHLIAEFDDEHFLLRRDLHALRDDEAVLRNIAGRLRNLVCRSSGTEGLLWRLVNELNVSDRIPLICPKSVNLDHSLNRGVVFEKLTYCRPEFGPPWFRSASYSLYEVIKTCEPIYVPSIHEPHLTHEWLIKEVAQQIGVCHVEGGVSPALEKILAVSGAGFRPLAQVLAFDAELTLQIGERILDAAEASGLHRRTRRAAPTGDVSIVAVVNPRSNLAGAIKLCSLRSYVSEADIELRVSPASASFTLFKRGIAVREITAPLSADTSFDGPFGVALCYSSNLRRIRLISSAQSIIESPCACDIGWLEERELGHWGDGNADSVTVSEFFHAARIGIVAGQVSPEDLGKMCNGII